MILVIGGAFQGKETYVKEHFPEPYLAKGAYHEKIKEQMKAGKEPLDEAEKMLEDARAAGELERLVVICDEVGYGLVPVDAFERAYREKVGRVCCYLAKEAEQVIRVVCGMGNRIK